MYYYCMSKIKKRNTRWTFIPFYFFLQQKVPLHGLQAIYFFGTGDVLGDTTGYRSLAVRWQPWDLVFPTTKEFRIQVPWNSVSINRKVIRSQTRSIGGGWLLIFMYDMLTWTESTVTLWSVGSFCKGAVQWRYSLLLREGWTISLRHIIIAGMAESIIKQA